MGLGTSGVGDMGLGTARMGTRGATQGQTGLSLGGLDAGAG